MSDANNKSQIEANLEKRAETQGALQREEAAVEASVKASYHHDQVAVDKAISDAVSASAEKERKAASTLDPLELIRQVQKMRDEGFDEATIRAAFQEVMGELTGQFRRPMRRVLKSEGMSKMLSQDEMNRHYEKLTYGRDGETDEQMDERIKLILERIEQTKDFKVEVKKPTLKNYLYRAAYFVLRRPLQFMIAFLTALREQR